MPRKTKQEKFREWEEMRLAQIEQDKAAYFPSLMNALEESSKSSDFDITVKDSKFVVSDRNDSREQYILSPEYSEKDFQVLLDLETTLFTLKAKREAAERRWALRVQALGKLTKEEREVLDLQ